MKLMKGANMLVHAKAVLSVALLSVLALFATTTPGHAIAVSCQVFMEHLQKAVPDLAAQFVRPVVVSRGTAVPGAEVRDLITNLRIDGQLYCNGDRFVRFEAKIHAPFAGKLVSGFERVEHAAAQFKLQWSSAKTASTLRRMRADAAEYMRASAERGDVFVSGKIEEHAGEAGDVAIVWTRRDRSFIIVEYRP